MKRELERIRENLHEELAKMADKSLNTGNLDMMYKMTCIIKNIDCMESDGEYSERYSGDYERGSSYRRRYSGDGGYGDGSRGYRSNGYYTTGSEWFGKMEEMADRADPEEQRIIKRYLDKLRNEM